MDDMESLTPSKRFELRGEDVFKEKELKSKVRRRGKRVVARELGKLEIIHVRVDENGDVGQTRKKRK
ncbi:unnamed protein product [Caenorhabditis nigoni]